MAGAFQTVGGTTRNRLAAVDTTGSLLAWNPSASSAAFALAISGDNVYIGGGFSSIAGASQPRLAIVNTQGSLISWDASTETPFYPLTGGQVFAIGVDSDTLLATSANDTFSMPIFVRLKDNKIINLKNK